MTEPLVTRRELDLLKAASDTEHSKLWQRIELMDDHGTRGVQGLTIRIDNLITGLAELKTEVKTDVNKLQTDMDARFEAHQKVHDQDAANRISARRWRIGTAIGAAASMAAVLGLLIEVVAKAH